MVWSVEAHRSSIVLFVAVLRKILTRNAWKATAMTKGLRETSFWALLAVSCSLVMLLIGCVEPTSGPWLLPKHQTRQRHTTVTLHSLRTVKHLSPLLHSLTLMRLTSYSTFILCKPWRALQKDWKTGSDNWLMPRSSSSPVSNTAWMQNFIDGRMSQYKLYSYLTPCLLFASTKAYIVNSTI